MPTLASSATCAQVVRLQRMFIRIINADFAPVPWLTSECRDLMARLLNPDPKARMTVTDALRHPWVRTTRRKPRPAGHLVTTSRLDVSRHSADFLMIRQNLR